MKGLLLFLGLLAPVWATAQSYTLGWYKIAGGGGSGSAGIYSLEDTIGQPEAGGPIGTLNYSLTTGFWGLESAISPPPVTGLSNPPVIVTEPESQSVVPGGGTSFGVSVSGPSPFTYQWLHNGTNIPNIPIFTVVGGSESGGQATNAAIYTPYGVAVDAAGNLYIPDTFNNLIHKVDSRGVITTVAGVGNGQLNGSGNNYTGDGVPATNASISEPFSVAVDAHSNIYIADTLNNRVRKVDTNGIITTVAGNGNSTTTGDGGVATGASVYQPRSVAVDGLGQIFIAEYAAGIVRQVNINGIITTVAGGGASAAASGLMAINCKLIAPSQVVVDSAGNFYVSDWYAGAVWKVAADGTISYVWHGFFNPGGFALGAAGSIYVANSGNNTVVEADSGGNLTVLAGKGPATFGGDGGLAVSANLNYPNGVVVDSAGNLYIADTFNNRIRKVSVSGVIETAAGNGFNFYAGDNGPAAGGYLAAPKQIAFDSFGNLFIADYNNFAVRRVDADGIITTVMGNGISGYTPPSYSGKATNTEIAEPFALAVDANDDFFLSDLAFNQILKVDSTGLVSTLLSSGVVSGPQAIACDSSGNIYVADRNNNYVRKITLAGGVTIVAGGGASQSDGVQATNAQLMAPNGLVFDSLGNLYVSLAGQSLVRKIDPSGVITTVAGNGVASYSGDGGAATSAGINQPSSLVFDSTGNLFIADSRNNCVRCVSPSGVITTTAGSGPAGYFGDGGEAVAAWLDNPVGLAMDLDNDLYIADSANNRVRKVLLNGSPTLALNDITAGEGGDYQVVVNNPWGSVTSSVVTLTVASPSATPIVFNGAANMGNGSLSLGGSASPGTHLILQMTPSLIPPIQWQPVATNTSSASGQWQFTPAIPTASLGGYFRVSAP